MLHQTVTLGELGQMLGAALESHADCPDAKSFYGDLLGQIAIRFGNETRKELAKLVKAEQKRWRCDHLNNQCKGDYVVCNECGETWLVEEEDG